MSLQIFVAALLTAIGLTGCGAAQVTSGCQLPPVVPQLVTPANGATGVATTIGALQLSNANSSNTITIRSSAGNLSGVGAVDASGAVTLPVLASATTYTVNATFAPSCGSGSSSDIGSFTTK